MEESGDSASRCCTFCHSSPRSLGTLRKLHRSEFISEPVFKSGSTGVTLRSRGQLYRTDSWVSTILYGTESNSGNMTSYVISRSSWSLRVGAGAVLDGEGSEAWVN